MSNRHCLTQRNFLGNRAGTEFWTCRTILSRKIRDRLSISSPVSRTRGTTKATSKFLLVSRSDDRSPRWTPFVCQTACHCHRPCKSCSKNVKKKIAARPIVVSSNFPSRTISGAGHRAASENVAAKTGIRKERLDARYEKISSTMRTFSTPVSFSLKP